MSVDYYGNTNIGNLRFKNEDAFVLQEIWGGSHLLAVVADGVGGNTGGDVAANLACKCISEHLTDLEFKGDHSGVLQAAVVYANNSIHAQHCNPWLSHMSCVLTAALINLENGTAEVCHIGDTRLYMFKSSLLTRITRDHSLVGPSEESKELTEWQAMKHPRRNIITRSVGQQFLQMGTEYMQTHILNLNPCTLMLCSDGLYDMVHSSEMAQILSQPISTEDRVNTLINNALKAGGKDNITIIIIDLFDNE